MAKDKDSGKFKSVKDVSNYLDSSIDFIRNEYSKRLMENKDLLEESKKIMESDKPYIPYSRNLFAKKFSKEIGKGAHIEPDMFILVMGKIMGLPEDNIRKLSREGILYKYKNTQEYYREGFDEFFSGNIIGKD